MWFLKTYLTKATIANQQDYSLPTLTRKVIQIKVDGYAYDQIPFDEVYDRYELPLSPVPILPSFLKRAYYYRYDSVYFIPIPSAAPTAVSVSSITETTGTATCTTASAHGYVRGDVVVFAGATPTLYNAAAGYTILTVPSTTTFTFAVTSGTGTASGTITVAANNIKIWYFVNPTAPTSTSSSIVVPDEFMDILVAYAEGRYWSYAHKRGKSADAFTEFESRLADLKKENFRKMYGENNNA